MELSDKESLYLQILSNFLFSWANIAVVRTYIHYNVVKGKNTFVEIKK